MTKTILVTGSTDGIGLETAIALLGEGHRVLIHGRNPQKLAKTGELLSAKGYADQIQLFVADLSELAEVRKLAIEVAEHTEQLDVLINNAGIFKTPEPLASNGLDVRFMVNTIAPWLLSKELLPQLSDTARIVNLSSAAQAPVQFDALVGRAVINDDFEAYAQSKLALTTWSMDPNALALKRSQSMVAVNPGSMLGSKMVKEGFGTSGKDIGIGVTVLKRMALDAQAPRSGEYFDNDIGEYANPHPAALDASTRQKLLEAMTAIIS